MNSRFSGGRQDVPALTVLQNRIPLMTPEGVERLTLPAGAAYTIVPTRGDRVGRNDRRMLDRYPGPHVIMVPADDTTAYDINPDLMAWAVRRSDFIVLWGCDAYAAAIAEVASRIKESKRVLLIMAACDAEAAWFDQVNRCSRRETPVLRLRCDLLNEPGTLRDAGAMPRPEVLH